MANIDDYVFRSRFEQQVAMWLEKHNVEYEYETVRLPYKKRVQSGSCDKCSHNKVSQNRTYTPDFILPALGIILEVKGHLSSTDRSKMRDVKAAHPERDIRLVFMSNNKVDKKSNDRYSDWADKNGFRFSVKTIPLDWIE